MDYEKNSNLVQKLKENFLDSKEKLQIKLRDYYNILVLDEKFLINNKEFTQKLLNQTHYIKTLDNFEKLIESYIASRNYIKLELLHNLMLANSFINV